MKTTINGLLGLREQKIVYNLLRTSAGWQLQAFLPRRVSIADKIKVIDWFHDYRTAVQKQHPLWLTSFNATDHAYFLDIVQASSPKDLIAKALDVAGQADHNFPSEPQQLSFDYAQ